MYPGVSSCRRLTPLARAGMEAPTGAHCLAKLATNTSPSTSPSLFPPLSFIPLSFSYFVSLSLCLYSFFFLFLWDSATYSPFSGNGLAPRSSHIAVVPHSRLDRPLVGRLSRLSGGHTEETEDRHRLRKGENKEGRLLEKGTRTTPYICYRLDCTLSSSLNKPQSATCYFYQ